MHHVFLHISLQLLHDYNVKLPNFTVHWGREHKTTIFFFFCVTIYSLFHFERTNKLDHNYYSYWQLLLLTCPLKYHVTWLYSINSKLHAKIVCIVNIVCWLEFQYLWILCSHCCRLGIILHQTGMGHNHSHGMGSSHGHGHSHSSNKEESIRRISRSNSLRHSEKENINVRAAFIHVLGDIVQSVGVLIAAYIIKFKVIQRM